MDGFWEDYLGLVGLILGGAIGFLTSGLTVEDMGLDYMHAVVGGGVLLFVGCGLGGLFLGRELGSLLDAKRQGKPPKQ